VPPARPCPCAPPRPSETGGPGRSSRRGQPARPGHGPIDRARQCRRQEPRPPTSSRPTAAHRVVSVSGRCGHGFVAARRRPAHDAPPMVRAEQLPGAMTSRVVIEQAKGAVAALRGISTDGIRPAPHSSAVKPVAPGRRRTGSARRTRRADQAEESPALTVESRGVVEFHHTVRASGRDQPSGGDGRRYATRSRPTDSVRPSASATPRSRLSTPGPTLRNPKLDVSESRVMANCCRDTVAAGDGRSTSSSWTSSARRDHPGVDITKPARPDPRPRRGGTHDVWSSAGIGW
jgi:hypothetical protein